MAANIKQYLRKWSMMINGEPFIDSRDGHQLRVVFDIEVRPSNTLALADIQLFNLAKSTTISQRDSIVFSAGYQDQHDTLFMGSVTNVFRERRGPDVVTRLLCRSGTARERGVISASFGAGAKLTDVLIAVARAWPLYLEIDLDQFDDKDVFPSGYTADGDVQRILDELKVAFDFEWTQERGSLVVTRPDRERTTPVFVIDQFSGMVGMPEVTRGPNGIGVNLTARINPFIRATSQIDVRSEFASYNTGNMMISELAGDASANGVYNVFSIQYVGDSHGEAWDMKIDAIRAGTREAAITDPGGMLVWGGRVEPEFRAKVRDIASRLRIDANWLMSVMHFETKGTFSPSIKNPNSSATGLIQFIESTAQDLGTSTKALANMTRIEQLDYVYMYYARQSRPIRDMSDAYMAVLWPQAVGKADDYVLWAYPSIYYKQNSGLDRNHDGTITKAEAASRVYNSFKEGMNHLA